MKRVLGLLPILLFASVTTAAPGLKPGGFAEFNVELPRDLRLVAGRGQLSPVAHALVTLAAPANLDMAHVWPVMVISATSDPEYNSSRLLMSAYAETALQAGWILVAVDPVEPVTVEKDDVALRLALNTAALAVLNLQWPAAKTAPLAFGGFSGGAKYSAWLAAAFAKEGRTITGIYLAGIGSDTLVYAAEHFQVMNASFKRVPVFLLSGDTDTVATPVDHLNVYNELTRAGFKNVRLEKFSGAHEVEPGPLRQALDWFREFSTVPTTAK